MYFGREALEAAGADLKAGHYGLAIMDILLAGLAFGGAMSELASETAGNPKSEADLANSPEPSDPFNILNKDFVPDPQRVLQNITNDVNLRLASDTSIAREVLSDAEVKASTSSNVGPMSYGNALERLVRQEIRNSELHGSLFEILGGKSQPDFASKGSAAGVNLDITTAAQISQHLARPGYGAGLQIILYSRPPGFNGF